MNAEYIIRWFDANGFSSSSFCWAISEQWIRLRMVENYAMGIETLAKNWWPARTLIRLSNVYLTPKIYNFTVVGVESCCTELFLTWQLAMLAPSKEIVQYNILFCTNWILSKGHFFGCSPIHTNLFAWGVVSTHILGHNTAPWCDMKCERFWWH